MPPVKILRLALLGDEGRTAADGAAGGADEDRTNVADFSVLATRTVSRYEGARKVELITDEADWRRVWALLGTTDRPAPEVNFATRAVLVVFQGRQPTGGYSIEVAEIRRVGTVLAVKVNKRGPAFGDVTTQVITSPFVAVSVPRPPQGATARLVGDAQRDGVQRTQPNRNKTARPPVRRGARGRRVRGR